MISNSTPLLSLRCVTAKRTVWTATTWTWPWSTPPLPPSTSTCWGDRWSETSANPSSWSGPRRCSGSLYARCPWRVWMVYLHLLFICEHFVNLWTLFLLSTGGRVQSDWTGTRNVLQTSDGGHVSLGWKVHFHNWKAFSHRLLKG